MGYCLLLQSKPLLADGVSDVLAAAHVVTYQNLTLVTTVVICHIAK
jgi:hypothetical protein